MRVIAGRHRGRRLTAPRSGSTRPTPERVREALFSSLEACLGGPGSLIGVRVLDLYAGSGALGIEALSRGADSAVFVERDSRALEALARNVESLGLGEQVRISRSDAAAALSRLAGEGRQFDVVFVDPPFASAEIERSLGALLVSQLLRPSGVAVVEHPSATAVESQTGFRIIRSKRYGAVAITLLIRADGEPAQTPEKGEGTP